MSSHTYTAIELTGSSPDGMQPAIENAIAHAARSIGTLRWFEVTETRGHIEDGKIAHWQVTLKAGYRLEDDGN